MAHLTIHAQAMGLVCRQFRAFDLPLLSEDLELAPAWNVVSMTAVGRAASANPERDRRDVRDLRIDPLRQGAALGSQANENGG